MCVQPFKYKVIITNIDSELEVTITGWSRSGIINSDNAWGRFRRIFRAMQSLNKGILLEAEYIDR